METNATTPQDDMTMLELPLATVPSLNEDDFQEILDAMSKEDALKQTGYEMRIKELEQQVEHHKNMSAQLQTIALENPQQMIPKERKKRKYNVSNYAAAQRSYINQTIKSDKLEQFAQDLLNGVGFDGLKAHELPRALLRAYVSFRYAKENPKTM